MLHASPLLVTPALLGFLFLLPPAVATSSRAWQPSPPCGGTHGLPSHCSDAALLAQVSEPDQDSDPDKRLILSNTELTLMEGKEGASFTVRLSSRLKDSEVVDVVVTSSNEENITISPASLQFTKENWQEPQAINLLLEDNEIDEYHRSEEISLSPSGSGYDKSNEEILSLIVTDPVKELKILRVDRTDIKGLFGGYARNLITSNSQLNATEGEKLIFEVKLSRPVTSPVTVDIILTDNQKGSIDSDEFMISPPSLTFTESDSNFSKIVTLSLPDNMIYKDDKTINICFDLSGDGYNEQVVPSLRITDDDILGLALNSRELTVGHPEK